jgi:hypothetical protein
MSDTAGSDVLISKEGTDDTIQWSHPSKFWIIFFKAKVQFNSLWVVNFKIISIL